jgi:hypothetical protein
MLRFPTPAPHAKLYFWNSGTTIFKMRGSASAGMSGYFYLIFTVRPGVQHGQEYPLKDTELLNQFKEVHQLPEDDKKLFLK